MAKFTLVVDNQESGTLKCNDCGCQFDWDIHKETNLVLDHFNHHLVPVCPACNAGKPAYSGNDVT